MPTVAGWVRELGEAFGFAEVGAVVRRGLAGEPVFWASEGGHEIGTRPAAGVEVVPLLPIVIERKGRQ